MTPGHTFVTLETRRESRASLILQCLVGPLLEQNKRCLKSYIPTQIHFPIGGDRVTCHRLKFTNSLEKQQLELSTRT